MGYSLSDRPDGMREWVASADEVRCPACGDMPDYCQGHGEIGDPAGYSVVEMHDTGNHSQCVTKCED